MLTDPFSGRVFVLGAGFSYFLSGSQLPLLNQLGLELSDGVPWIRERSPERGHFDVERLLTDLDLEIQSTSLDDPGYQGRIERRCEIIRFIVNRLSLTSISDSAMKTASAFCLNLFKPGDFILTFNWDCLLDTILWQGKIWTPCGGYGDIMSIPVHSEVGQLNPFFITLLKLHGSVNFAFPTYGGPFLTLFRLSDIFPDMTDITVSGSPYDDALPVVSLPTYVKRFGESRSTTDLWLKATEMISYAETLVIAGYSFPAADVLARMMVASAGTNQRLNHIAILTGTERESREIQSRIREVATLPRDRYLREPERYDENVEWEIIAAENGLGFSRLQEVLQKWPAHDLKNAILARAAFQTDFLFWQMLHDSTKDES